MNGKILSHGAGRNEKNGLVGPCPLVTPSIWSEIKLPSPSNKGNYIWDSLLKISIAIPVDKSFDLSRASSAQSSSSSPSKYSQFWPIIRIREYTSMNRSIAWFFALIEDTIIIIYILMFAGIISESIIIELTGKLVELAQTGWWHLWPCLRAWWVAFLCLKPATKLIFHERIGQNKASIHYI